MHIRDKTVADLLQDLKTLKIYEAWKLGVVATGILSAFAAAGYQYSGRESRLDTALCKVSLERRTELLRDAFRQTAGELQTRIQSEIKDGRIQ